MSSFHVLDAVSIFFCVTFQTLKLIYQNLQQGAVETVQQLRAPLTEDPDLILNTHMVATVLGDATPSSGLFRNLINLMHINTCSQNANTHRIEMN